METITPERGHSTNANVRESKGNFQSVKKTEPLQYKIWRLKRRWKRRLSFFIPNRNSPAHNNSAHINSHWIKLILLGILIIQIIKLFLN